MHMPIACVAGCGMRAGGLSIGPDGRPRSHPSATTVRITAPLPERSSEGFGGDRLDPFLHVRLMQDVVGLQKLADFYHGTMDDRVSDDGTEKSSLELSTFLEILRPFAARRGTLVVSPHETAPGRLQHRLDPS